MAGRFVSNSFTCLSGLLSVLLRNKITEGLFSSHNASKVPKSVSAETSMRSSAIAREKITLSHQPTVIRSHEHARSRALPCGVHQQVMATGHYLSKTSW